MADPQLEASFPGHHSQLRAFFSLKSHHLFSIQLFNGRYALSSIKTPFSLVVPIRIPTTMASYGVLRRTFVPPAVLLTAMAASTVLFSEEVR